MRKLAVLGSDLGKLALRMEYVDVKGSRPWNMLWLWGEQALSLEGQEALLSILLEPYGELIDELSAELSANEEMSFRLNGAMSVVAMRSRLEEFYDWALAIDFDEPDNCARFWYVSEEKLEPRLVNRAEEAGAELEQPLCVAWLAKELHGALQSWAAKDTLASFLLQHPEHRFMVRCTQMGARFPYAEVRDNLIGKDMLPIDLMRYKLAFFGASHFDPRSDRWVRISLFQGSPYPDELKQEAGYE